MNYWQEQNLRVAGKSELWLALAMAGSHSRDLMKVKSTGGYVKIWIPLLAGIFLTVGALTACGMRAGYKPVRATTPEPRLVTYSWMSLSAWYQRHAADVALAEAGQAKVVFLGDSITEAWSGAIWNADFAPLGAVNFGIGGDATQNVLWRLQYGGVGALKPQAVVLLIGTNNFGIANHSEADVLAGVQAVVAEVRESFPGAKLLLFGIFPRDANPNAPIRAKIASVNQKLAALHDGQHVFFEDIGERFLEPNGSISTAVMPDALHLSAEGYRRWAEVIRPYLQEWVGAGQ